MAITKLILDNNTYDFGGSGGGTTIVEKKLTYIKTVGFSADNDYVCDGTADNIQVQAAINEVAAAGGGTVYILGGKYSFSCVVYLDSNVSVVMCYDTVIKLTNQYIATLPSKTTKGSATIAVTGEILKNIIVGQEVGFTNGKVGYVTEGENAFGTFVTAIDDKNNTITVLQAPQYEFTTICTLNSAFRFEDQRQSTYYGIGYNISISGGEIDCNRDNAKVWITDLFQNGIIIGGVAGLEIKDVRVHDCCFQAIHVCGPWVSDYWDGGTDYDNYTTLVERCTAWNCNFAAICVDSYKEAVVKDCIGRNSTFGLQFVASSNCKTYGGYYYNNSFCGVRYATIDNDDFVFHGVTATNNARGIGITNLHNSTIANCFIEGNTEYGIAIEEESSYISITGCSLKDNAIGIWESSSGTENNTICNCTFNNNINDYSIDTATIIGGGSGSGALIDDSVMISSSDKNLIASTPTGYAQYVEGTVPNVLTISSHNLFDVTTYVSEGAYQGYRGTRLQFKPNTYYTCSTEATSGNTVYFGQSLSIGVDESGGVLTAQTDENGYIYLWLLSDRSDYSKYLDGSLWLQIEEGKEATSYTPVGEMRQIQINDLGQIFAINSGLTIVGEYDFSIKGLSYLDLITLNLNAFFSNLTIGATPTDGYENDYYTDEDLGIEDSDGSSEDDTEHGILLYNWDFTAGSLIDTVAGISATNTGATLSSDGLSFAKGSQNVLLGTDVFGVGRTLEIVTGEMSRQFDSSTHGRTFMIYSTDTNKSEGLVYRWQSQCWSFYVNGAWATDSTLTDANYFDNCTLKFVSDSKGYINLYKDGELVYTSSRAFDKNRTAICLGGYADSFYNMTIKSVSIYS
jgi:hypothetical protein